MGLGRKVATLHSLWLLLLAMWHQLTNTAMDVTVSHGSISVFKCWRDGISRHIEIMSEVSATLWYLVHKVSSCQWLCFLKFRKAKPEVTAYSLEDWMCRSCSERLGMPLSKLWKLQNGTNNFLTLNLLLDKEFFGNTMDWQWMQVGT